MRPERDPLITGTGLVTETGLVTGTVLAAGGRAGPAVDAVVERLDAERVPGAEQFPRPGVPDRERLRHVRVLDRTPVSREALPDFGGGIREPDRYQPRMPQDTHD